MYVNVKVFSSFSGRHLH